MIVPDLTPTEFLSLASSDKIALIDRLAARELELGQEYALASAEYHRQKLADVEKVNFEQLTFDYFRLQAEYDALTHAVLALQSTLKAERFPGAQ